jgi:hypothetical protein
MPNHIHGIIEINRSRITLSDPIKTKPYVTLLSELSTQKGILEQIFTISQNKIQDPDMLANVIDIMATKK